MPAWRGTPRSRCSTSWHKRCDSGAKPADPGAMKIAVLGVGLIGGSVGLAARADGAEVSGFGRSPERLERARELGAIDSAAGSMEEALNGAEACFACGPVGALPGQVREAL